MFSLSSVLGLQLHQQYKIERGQLQLCTQQGAKVGVMHQTQLIVTTPDEMGVPVDYGTLCADPLLLLYSQLNLRDLLSASSVCFSWHRCLSAVWRPRCLSRWRHWSAPPPALDADPAVWRDTYIRRHKVDAHVLDLLSETCWPAQQAAAYSTILGYGADALDVLAAAAQASTHSGMYIGLAFRAQTALLLVQGQLATQRIQELLTADSKADAAGDLACVGAVQSTSDDLLLEVALQVTQALHPLSDICAVRRALHQLGDELKQRLREAEVEPHSRQALDMLNALLLAKPISTWPSSARISPSTPQQQAQQDTAQSQCTLGWAAVWLLLDELRGPDMSQFVVPTGAFCGLGLEGQQELLLQRSSCCLDSVLVQGSGHPVVMAVLHRAVGRRAGLDIDLVGVPDSFDGTAMVLTRAKFCDDRLSSINDRMCGCGQRAAAAQASCGGPDCAVGKKQAHAVHFSVFSSQIFGEDAVRPVNNRPQPQRPSSAASTWPDCLPAMTADSVCKALLSHICVLVQQSSFLIHVDAQPPLLTAFALQLGALQPGVLQPYVANILGSLLSDEGMGRLYIEMLKESAELQKVLQEELMLSSLFNPIKQPLVQLSSSRPAGQHQLGSCVLTRSPFAPDDPEDLSIVTGWHSTGYFEVQPEWDVLMCGTQTIRDPQYVCPFLPMGRQTTCAATAEQSQDTPAAPWWAGSSCQGIKTVALAVKLLRDLWFEADFGQQLELLLVSCAQESARAAEHLGALAALPPASKHALGRYFDAVWYDEQQEQCMLLPNAYLRVCYPDG